jgi:putative membrane-bound dehydrogenase-like protein
LSSKFKAERARERMTGAEAVSSQYWFHHRLQFDVMKTMLLTLLPFSGLMAAEFPAPYNSEPGDAKPVPAVEAAGRMRLPAGFKATVFAAEPDVQNPIAMAWDARGRLWLAENYTYAEDARKFDLALRDRILIFEDTDGDGRFDKRTVFTDELQMLTSIEVGHGGVWVMCPPRLLFFPDRDGDDSPDGPAEVVLDGFAVSMDSHHTFANGLRFGPDGWLYGRCGASCPGEIGAPGTPAAERVPLRGTIWRYHPQRKVVEVLSSGTTNPWGHDWTEYGELFFINTVNGHLWHDFPGAHFERPHTFDPNPRVYALIDQHADHWHFDVAKGWQRSRDGAANDLGGGHAHVGMMIYQGDNWPAEYRGHLFTLNLHGRRANQEILERSGSGYVGKHGRDFLVAEDPWFRGMDLSYGPDGGVFVLDWSDTGECHENTGVHRTSGRIFKITYGNVRHSGSMSDVAKLSVAELVKLHTHPNDWFSRQARLELAGRAESAPRMDAGGEALRRLFETHDDVVVKLRAFWTLHAIGAMDQAYLCAQLNHPNEHVRTWAIRFLSDAWPLDTVLSRRPVGRAEVNASPEILRDFARLAKEDSSGLVRLALASTLQRLPISQRLELASPLLAHEEDANDHNLPLLIWYGLIPAGELDPAGLARLAVNSGIPLTRKLIARRLGEDVEKNPAPLNELLEAARSRSAAFQADLLNGLSDALIGWRQARKPAAWDGLASLIANSPDPALRDRARDLSVLFGDGRALEEVRKVALDKAAALEARKVALQTLIDSRAPGLRALCEQLLPEEFINSVAVRGLASFDDPAIGAEMVKVYRRFHASERGQLLSALASRASFATALLDAVAQKKIPRDDMTAFHARQIRSLNDPVLDRKLAATWGELRDSPQDKQQSIRLWKSRLTKDTLAKADLGQGRVVFNAVCGACHTLYGEGGKVGPDLTGGGRDNLDYLLENIVDPSAVVASDFRMSIVELTDGRTINGLISARTERTLTLKTMTETVTVERSAITRITESTLSLMPEGLLDALPSGAQARDLIAYLMHQAQVPLPSAGLPAK